MDVANSRARVVSARRSRRNVSMVAIDAHLGMAERRRADPDRPLRSRTVRTVFTRDANNKTRLPRSRTVLEKVVLPPET